MQVTLLTKKKLPLLGLLALVACGGNSENRTETTGKQPQVDVQSQIGMPLREQTASEQGTGILRDEVLRRWLDYRQIDRIAYADRFQFPNFRHNAREDYTEARVQPPLDILLIVDDSGSMSSYQANLATKLDPLLSFVQGSDWRIHVVTTDSDVGCSFRATINKSDLNFQTNFRTAVSPGTGGSSDERGILIARRSLESPCGGAWLRPNSALAILVVSDEDTSDPSETLTDYLGTIRRLGDNARVYGIIGGGTTGTANSCQSPPPSGANKYYQAIHKTGGICGDISLTDYTSTLKKISEDAASLLPPNIQLGRIPTNGQVTVSVNGQPLPTSSYRLEDRNLFLLVPILTGQRLEVTYVYDDPFARDFPLTNPAAADTVRVISNGSALLPTDFTYNTATRKVSIDSSVAVQPSQSLEVTYRENKPLMTTFFSGPVPDPATIQCFLNDGTELHNFTFDAARQAIVFSVPPTEMQFFKCSLIR